MKRTLEREGLRGEFAWRRLRRWWRRQIPEISRFFGIVIRMFVEAGEPHNRPHFHAYHEGKVGIYAIDSLEPLAGSLPLRQERLVIAWAEIHLEELLANWSILQAGRPPARIAPLR
ncbi:MAG TPA: DUF4160 domain-containing protein [Thermoanaerobaculia bacterium]|nr:DUF4160 domain-containing protein [Thermoanaerobaculia bacterium]